MVRERAALLSLTAAFVLVAAVARAHPHSASSSASGDAFRLIGWARTSSTGVARSPEYTLVNRAARPRVVELVSLVSLGSSSRATLRIRGPRRLTVRPHGRRHLAIDFRGDALQSAIGLPYHRFLLSIRVDGRPLRAIASQGYACRIPVHHL